jgi:release factor glutamine methyltransferase
MLGSHVNYIYDKLRETFHHEEAMLLSKYLIQDLAFDEQVSPKALDPYIERLISQEPLQYITGKSYFLDYIFYVDKNVLIPRPETEELVLWAVDVVNFKNITSALEIGVGSGCISISLKLRSKLEVMLASDIDSHAIAVAKKNASNYNCQIQFLQHDFLVEETWIDLPKTDLVISNPPYITPAERKDMESKVIDYEPNHALFPPGDDPLLFYVKLAQFCAQRKAIVMCELNEYYPQDIKKIFHDQGYLNIELRKDLQGKERMLLAF